MFYSHFYFKKEIVNGLANSNGKNKEQFVPSSKFQCVSFRVSTKDLQCWYKKIEKKNEMANLTDIHDLIFPVSQ